MVLRVYCTHWSDNNEKWGKPTWTTYNLRDLSLPFGYFLAPDQKTADIIVDLLPNMPDMVHGVITTPIGFYLGSFPYTKIEFNPHG